MYFKKAKQIFHRIYALKSIFLKGNKAVFILIRFFEDFISFLKYRKKRGLHFLIGG